MDDGNDLTPSNRFEGRGVRHALGQTTRRAAIGGRAVRQLQILRRGRIQSDVACEREGEIVHERRLAVGLDGAGQREDPAIAVADREGVQRGLDARGHQVEAVADQRLRFARELQFQRKARTKLRAQFRRQRRDPPIGARLAEGLRKRAFDGGRSRTSSPGLSHESTVEAKDHPDRRKSHLGGGSHRLRNQRFRRGFALGSILRIQPCPARLKPRLRVRERGPVGG